MASKASGNLGVAALVASVLVAAVCGGAIVWRLTRAPPPEHPEFQVRPAPTAAPPVGPLRISPIIDLPGDPVLVRRSAVAAPRETTILVPAKLGDAPPKAPAGALFVASPLVSTTGGYLGKFPEAGQEADALAAQIVLNSEAGANFENQTDVGYDDDGGADTPAEAEARVLTSANSNVIEVRPDEAAEPELREVLLKPPVAIRLADLLTANGFSSDSARLMEEAAFETRRLKELPPQSVALAVGDRDVTGQYRVKQLVVFENGEYVVTLAWKDEGGYDEAAEPDLPPDVLEDQPAAAPVLRYTLADGLYSAGLRNGVTEGVIREAIELIARLADLRAPLAADQTLRLLYQREPRDKAHAAGRVVYVGVQGAGVSVTCYAFQGAGGGFRCFDPNAEAETKAGSAKIRPLPGSLGNSGATSLGGVLAPIKGAPVTSLFGMRFHPILHILRLHAGIDFGAPIGSLVRAAADGKVEFAGPASGFGNHVRIQHAGFETSYSHLSEIPDSIRPGAEVKQGDIIARSGNSGLSTGPHLHFQYYVGGAVTDPLPHLGSEVQSSASTYAGPVSAMPVPRPDSGAAAPAEIGAFPAMKAYIDAQVAELIR